MIREEEFEDSEETMTSYSLSIHWKQGTDFADCLDRSRAVSEALKLWADDLQSSRQKCLRLAKLLKGKDVEASAGENSIDLWGDEEALERAEKEGLLGKLVAVEAPF